MVKTKKILTKTAKQTEIDQILENERQEKIRRLQELESSSTSTSSSESTESYVSIQEISEEEDGFVDILDNLYDTDNESLQDEDPDYIKRKTIEEEDDFFNMFGEVPDLDNISEDLTIASIAKGEFEIDPTKDVGIFVDPLTGGVIPSSEESTTSIEIDVDHKEELDQEESSSGRQPSEEGDLLLPDDIYEVDEQISSVPPEALDTLETFLELEIQPKTTAEDDIDWEAIAKEEESRIIHQNTIDFITQLIKRVVDVVEYVSPETVLRHNLDKRKLLAEISTKYHLFSVESNVCQFLNRKVVEYFRRKKSYRPIMQDNAKTLEQNKFKFAAAIERLDHLLGQELELSNSTSEQIEKLQKQYMESKRESLTQVELFESKVQKLLFRDSHPKLNVVLEQLLRKMDKYRKEVNQVRFVLLTKQHNQARLTELLAKLEDLGNGLSMRDFSTLQAETQTLGKKIEERNTELNKLHIRCHNDIHTLAHCKEKQKMLRHTIAVQRSILESLLDEKQSLRERLNYLKLNHNRIRRQIKELSFQGGLLDKPSLMIDYDATVELLKNRHEKVDYLKKSLLQIEQKIEKIVKQY